MRLSTAAVAAITVLAVAVPAAAAACPPSASTTRLQRQAEQLVRDGQPGVIVETRDAGRVTQLAAGVADEATGAPMAPDDHLHVGSVTKTFVATVVLQLVQEHRLALDEPLSQVLPGELSGTAYDPARITVRMLLQHTSGIRDYLDSPRLQSLPALARTWKPQQLVNIAAGLGSGVSGWHYSNTNYILAGMIVQRITGHPITTEVRRRIIEPLHLSGTSFPTTSTAIPAPYAHGYFTPFGDVTHAVNPSAAGAAGAMISTVDDLTVFYRALFDGQLLDAAGEAALRATVPADDDGLYAENYGLGVYRVTLSCGTFWGHDGGYPGGYKTFAYTSPNGARQAVIAYNDFGISDGTDNPGFRADVRRLTHDALCGR